MIIGQNVLCIYQDGNIDSFLGAWVIWRQYPNATFIPRIEQTLPSDLEGRDVFIIGTTLPLTNILPMAEFCRSLTIIGFEKTFLEEVAQQINTKPDNAQFITNTNYSLSTLTWEVFNEGMVPPPLFSYVEDKALWRFQFTETRPVLAALMGYRPSFDLWDPLITASDIQCLVDEGRVILKRLIRDVEYALRFSQRRVNIGGYDVPVVNATPLIASDAGIQLAKGEPFAACYWDTQDGREYDLVSTQEGIDVSELVRAFGGHGNPNEAFFRVSKAHPLAYA